MERLQGCDFKPYDRKRRRIFLICSNPIFGRTSSTSPKYFPAHRGGQGLVKLVKLVLPRNVWRGRLRRADLVEAPREVRLGGVGELVSAGGDFRGGTKHGPVARGQSRVGRGQGSEGASAQIGEAELERAVAKPGHARQIREGVGRHRLDQAGGAVVLAAGHPGACAHQAAGGQGSGQSVPSRLPLRQAGQRCAIRRRARSMSCRHWWRDQKLCPVPRAKRRRAATPPGWRWAPPGSAWRDHSPAGQD